MWYKVKKIYVWNNLVWPEESSAYFDFWDWTNSQWTVWPASSAEQWTITKTATYISFYNGSSNTSNYLSQYPIDWTKNFLLEFNANIPNTSLSYHSIWLVTAQNDNSIDFHTNRESTYRNKIWCETYDWTNRVRQSWETNPWTADYFIKKEWNALTMWWNWVTKYTASNFSFASTYYLFEGVYRATATIYTAKLTYL
jgi:hypothetical protein